MSYAWLNDYVHVSLVPDAANVTSATGDGFHFAVKELRAASDLLALKEIIVSRIADSVRHSYIAAGYLASVVLQRPDGKCQYLDAAAMRALVSQGFDTVVECRQLVQAGMDPVMLGDSHVVLYGSRFLWKDQLVSAPQALGILRLLRDSYQPPAPMTAASRPADIAVARAISARQAQPIGLILPSNRM